MWSPIYTHKEVAEGAKCSRVIAKAGRRDHISLILFKLNWLPVEFRIKKKILQLTYRVLLGLAPTYITELLVPDTPPRTLRSSTEQLFVSPKSTDLKTLVPGFSQLRL